MGNGEAPGPLSTGPGPRRALLIGCGIAGPVLALFLQRIGVEAVIHEASEDPRDDVGAFLNLAPNGLAVLETLGIRENVEKYGSPTTSTAFLNHRGKQLGENPAETLLLKRGLLNKALREAALERGITIEFGKFFESVTESPDGGGVVVRFRDGSTAEGDFLVGCDGIHSKTRYSVLPDAPKPAYTGVIGTAGYTHSAHGAPEDGTMRMSFCLDGFFGHQTTPGGEIYWFENYHQAHEPGRGEVEAVSHEVWQRHCWTSTARTTPPCPSSSRTPRTASSATPSTTCPPSPPGTRAASVSSATPHTPPRRTSARVPRWQWRTPSCSPSACATCRT